MGQLQRPTEYSGSEEFRKEYTGRWEQRCGVHDRGRRAPDRKRRFGLIRGKARCCQAQRKVASRREKESKGTRDEVTRKQGDEPETVLAATKLAARLPCRATCPVCASRPACSHKTLEREAAHHTWAYARLEKWPCPFVSFEIAPTWPKPDQI